MLPWWWDMMGGIAVGGPGVRWQALRMLVQCWLCRRGGALEVGEKRGAAEHPRQCRRDGVMGASGVCSRVGRKETWK